MVVRVNICSIFCLHIPNEVIAKRKRKKTSVQWFLNLNDINIKILNNTPRYIRNIDKHGIADFKIKLSLETWDNVFDNNDVNSPHNSFLNTYFRVFYSSFPV